MITELKQRGILTVFIDRDIGGERLSVFKKDNFPAGRLANKKR
ncbi:hypothetical protein [Psychromonas hadalis]|nr:hypothetical protein [Psychromonas hadalis]